VTRIAFAALAALFFCSSGLAGANPASSTSAGRWSIVSRSDDTSRVQLRLEYSETSADGNSNSSWSSSVPTADAGLPIEKLRGPIGPVTFAIQREPGTFNCTGSAGEGSGAGQFTYAENARFDDALASRGLGRPTLHQSLELAISGTTLAFVDQIRSMASRSTIGDIVRVVEHGVTPKYIADLASLGYRVTSLDQLVRLRDHGVTTDFIRAVQSAGYRNLSPDDLVRLADHGVREKYIADMRAAGYTNLSADDLVALRDHGVTLAFVERLKAHGYTNVSVHDLIRLRDAGI
jgi:hypothetical protein